MLLGITPSLFLFALTTASKADPFPSPVAVPQASPTCIEDGICAIIGNGVNMTLGTCCPPKTCTAENTIFTAAFVSMPRILWSDYEFSD